MPQVEQEDYKVMRAGEPLRKGHIVIQRTLPDGIPFAYIYHAIPGEIPVGICYQDTPEGNLAIIIEHAHLPLEHPEVLA